MNLWHSYIIFVRYVCVCVFARSMYCTLYTHTLANISFNSLPTDVAADDILRWIIFIFSFHFYLEQLTIKFSRCPCFWRMHNFHSRAHECVSLWQCGMVYASNTRRFISRRDKNSSIYLTQRNLTRNILWFIRFACAKESTYAHRTCFVAYFFFHSFLHSHIHTQIW